jgi:serine/threonine-protein kinase
VAGREAKLGRTVFLTASKGLREIVIPDLRGKSLHQAEISLVRAGLKQGKLIQGAHAGIPRGVVIRTEPVAGKLARIGDTVRIVVSAGFSAGKVMLPSFVKQSMEDAIQKLESLGFTIGDVHRKQIPDGISGTVLEQIPQAGEFLPTGSKIDLIVVD